MTDIVDRVAALPKPVELVDTSGVPFRVSDELHVPAERYYEAGFNALERDKVWFREWQPACRLEEIPNPGDFTEYQILDQSILLIRQHDRSVRGFYNACRHRGTALGRGTGSFRSGQVLCPFHGWRWNLDGSNSYVYAKEAFRPDCVTKADVDLPPVKIGLRFGWAWVSMADEPVPFDEYFDGVGHAVDLNNLDTMHVRWWHRIELNANWKIAQEAFQEAYHVMQTHPELALFERDEGYSPFKGAGHFFTTERGHTLGNATTDYRLPPPPEAMEHRSSHADVEFRVASMHAMWEGSQSTANQRMVDLADELITTVPPEQFHQEFSRRYYEGSAELGVPTPPPDPEMSGYWTFFPNFQGVCAYGEALVDIARPHPDDPANKCIHEFWALGHEPAGTPRKRPVLGEGADWDDLWFVHQDVGNIERIQIGVKTRGFQRSRLAPDLERMIINWHTALDQHLAK